MNCVNCILIPHWHGSMSERPMVPSDISLGKTISLPVGIFSTQPIECMKSGKEILSLYLACICSSYSWLSPANLKSFRANKQFSISLPVWLGCFCSSDFSKKTKDEFVIELKMIYKCITPRSLTSHSIIELKRAMREQNFKSPIDAKFRIQSNVSAYFSK